MLSVPYAVNIGENELVSLSTRGSRPKNAVHGAAQPIEAGGKPEL